MHTRLSVPAATRKIVRAPWARAARLRGPLAQRARAAAREPHEKSRTGVVHDRAAQPQARGLRPSVGAAFPASGTSPASSAVGNRHSCTCTGIRPTCKCSTGSAGLEEQDGLRPKVEVDEILGRVDHVRAEVGANHHMPCRAARPEKREIEWAAHVSRAYTARRNKKAAGKKREMLGPPTATTRTCTFCRTPF